MDAIFNISEAQIMDFVTQLLTVFKKLMAWLGILVLPDEGELPTQPTSETEPADVEEG